MPLPMGVILAGERGVPLIPAEPVTPNRAADGVDPEVGQEVEPRVQQASEGEDAGASPDTSPAPRRAFARLREEEQRVAGGGRWSVDASRRHCHRCGDEIVRGTAFWTVLAEADPDQAGESVAAFFSRQDHCEVCIEALEDDPFFARWKTTVPAPEGPPRRIVNIASLLATFLSLIDSLESNPNPVDPNPVDPNPVD
ncbi:MAG: hypothetical protein OSB09_09065, partial [Planctomycetota bacterium]|nr:hypothetical protein [Planctomycetota bacterium]